MEIGVIGGGIIGITLARALMLREPSCRVTILEKERSVGRHQTSHNSGVVHAGLYYKPGSLKAQLCGRGRGMMREYCKDRNIPYRESGKLVVAVSGDELPGLREIQRRATANGVPDLKWVSADEIPEIEPHVRGAAALFSPHTAVVDFGLVARSVAEDVGSLGGRILTDHSVVAIGRERGCITVCAADEQYRFDRVVICAGLQTDRVSAMAGGPVDPRIIPFIGMYYRLIQRRRYLVKSLIYPVPDPRYPFLGVHLTRTIGDDVLIGPNALLALAREGYRATGVDIRDVAATLSWPGFYRLARQNWRAGATELVGAAMKRAFVKRARRYVPDLGSDDVERSEPGVRAQAVNASGDIVDDFMLLDSDSILSVRNAPSPAATSSLAIADYLVPRVFGHT